MPEIYIPFWLDFNKEIGRYLELDDVIYIPFWLDFNRCLSMTVFPMLINGVSVYVLFKYIKFTIFLKIIQCNTN